MNFLERIDRIELKIRQLVQRIDRLKLENADLKDENQKLKDDLDRQRGSVSALTNKLEQTQRSLDLQREGQPEQPDQLKQQLEAYIEEINSCIEWLHKQ
ncbi:MAG: hypothetical protein HRU12_24010 [Phaeodactylibacter sp.]|nr:hypothetical protein [Phaeodactylibacter sp.]